MNSLKPQHEDDGLVVVGQKFVSSVVKAFIKVEIKNPAVYE